MRFLLDENFPVALTRRLRQSGIEADHLIELGQRGLPDSTIRARLESETDLVFLTQDVEFEEWDFPCRGILIVSYLAQGLKIEERIAMWLQALGNLEDQPADIRLFEIREPGLLIPIEVRRI